MMQAKDIPNRAFLLAARQAHQEFGYASLYGVHTVLSRSMPDLPLKVTRAKLYTLDRQRIIKGCPCGCSSPLWLTNPSDLDSAKRERRYTRKVMWDHDAAVLAAIDHHAPEEPCPTTSPQVSTTSTR